MFKSTIKNLIIFFAKMLPWGGKKALMDALIADYGRGLVFSEIGREFSVQRVEAKGNYGEIQGSIHDLIVFGQYMETGTWASNVSQVLLNFFAENGRVGTYLDIGANIGLTLIPIATMPNVQCHAFEPEPQNFVFLSKNIEQCINHNIVLHNIALYDKSAYLPFAISPVNAGAHYLQINSKDNNYSEDKWETIEIEAARLDEILSPNEILFPLAVKIDTEGAEPFIISGGMQILEKASLLIIEFSAYSIRRMGGDALIEINFLETNFSEGAIVKGNRNEAPSWYPIHVITAQLRQIWDESKGKPLDFNRYVYFDIFVRKA